MPNGMTKELVINQIYTSLVETCEGPYSVDLDRYNNRERELISFFPQVRKRMVKTPDFYHRLSNVFRNTSEILPTGCKFYKQIGANYKVVVIEEQPRIRTIFVDTGIEAMLEKLELAGKLKEYGFDKFKFPKRDGAYAFQLSFPFVVFVITLDGNNNLRRIKPFFRLHPIHSLADYLFKAPLYNIPSDQSMCLGNVETLTNMAETVEHIVERFWFNIYNHDYSNNIIAYQETDQHEVHDYLSWMFYTQMDPMFIYNIKWLTYQYNIGQLISHVTNDADDNRNSSGIFKALFDSAFEASSSTIPSNPQEKNVTYSCIVSGDSLAVGDELLYDEKPMYLYSIIGNGYEISAVELEDEDGAVIRVSFDDFENSYDSIIKSHVLLEANVNNIMVRPGDMITMRINGITLYKKISSLRTGQDGRIEAFIGNDHYLLQNIDFEKIDIEEIYINDQKVTAGMEFISIVKSDTNGPVFATRRLRYIDLKLNDNGQIILKFENRSSGSYATVSYDKIKSGRSEYTFIEEDDQERIDIMHYGDRILVAVSSILGDGGYMTRILGKGILLSKFSLRSFMASSTNVARDEILDKVLIEGGTRLFMKGIYHDIDFKVGDPIIYADWRNPERMLHVSGIESFVVREDVLYVIAKSVVDKQVFEIPMINTRSCRTNVGAIVKVFSKCGDWNVGDKIKANTTGIYNFPKKDTNSITAFINVPGTKYPVALCSNLCTLWMNEDTYNHFDKVSSSEAKWKRMKVTPFDLDKIKWQHGDFFKERRFANDIDTVRSTIYCLTKRGGTMYGLDHSSISSWGNYDYGNYITKKQLVEDKIRHGILMPRFQITNRVTAPAERGYYNMLGGYAIEENSRVIVKSDQFRRDF